MTDWIANGESGASVRAKLNVFQPNRITVNLSCAQILALDVTPVLIVPAPGAGNFIRVLNIIEDLTFGTTPYSDVSSSAGLYYGDANGFTVDGVRLSILSEQSSSKVVLNTVENNPIMQGPKDSFVNQPITASAIGGAPTGGDGTIKVTIDYVIDALL